MSPRREIGDPLERVTQTGKIGGGSKPAKSQSEKPQTVLPISSFASETTNPQVVLPESREVGLYTSGFAHKTTNPQVDKPTNGEVALSGSGFVGKPEKPQVEKYTTHLRPETIRAIKLYAVTHDMKDYEVAQMLFDLAFKEIEKREER